ncbi:MAG: DUF2974 domain-containing protein, partial [Eggerthellaceae bacterium]|nr:DUF2974 domain-containing protein [Eggerthellaceae bacterium]
MPARCFESHTCACGNLPRALLAYGKPERVVEETKSMLDACTPGSGFVMDCSIVCDHFKVENFDAWYETALEYGKCVGRMCLVRGTTRPKAGPQGLRQTPRPGSFLASRTQRERSSLGSVDSGRGIRRGHAPYGTASLREAGCAQRRTRACILGDVRQNNELASRAMGSRTGHEHAASNGGVMEHTIVEYLHGQRASFDDVPLNDADSLVLTTIAYFYLENGMLGRTVPTELVPLPIALCGISHAELFGDIWLERMGGDEFLAALLASPRFMALNIGYYINEVSGHFEKQFAACTFFFPDGSAYAAFRGTENSR